MSSPASNPPMPEAIETTNPPTPETIETTTSRLHEGKVNMSLSTLPESETLWRAIFDQNWLHARHVEVQRFTYAGLYGGTTITTSLGAAALLTQWDYLWVVYAFIAGLTLMQALVSLKLGTEFRNHIQKIEAMLTVLPAAYRSFVGLPQSGIPFGRYSLPIRLRWLVPMLYVLMMTGWVAIAYLSYNGDLTFPKR